MEREAVSENLHLSTCGKFALLSYFPKICYPKLLVKMFAIVIHMWITLYSFHKIYVIHIEL